MSKKRNYFKWKLRAGTRGTIRRTSRRTGNGFEVMGACIALLDHARTESHWKDNPEGVFKTSVEDLATDYATPEHRVRETLGALVATGWLQASGDVAVVGAEDEVHFRIIRYLAFNDPQGSDADRKAAQRDREIVEEKALTLRFLLATDIEPALVAELPDLQASVTGRPVSAAMSLEGEENKKESKKEDTSSTSDKPKRDLSAEAQLVFDHWVSTWQKRSNTVFSRDRKAATIARLNEGYTVDQLKEAISGYRHSPHHMGTGPNSGGKAWDDLELFMRSGSKVDAGVAHGVAAASRVSAGTPVQSNSIPRHVISEEYDDGIQWHDNQHPAA